MRQHRKLEKWKITLFGIIVIIGVAQIVFALVMQQS